MPSNLSTRKVPFRWFRINMLKENRAEKETACRGGEIMREFIPEIKRRRAKRAMSEKEIPDDVIHRIMTAATLAPSCSNNQPWRFLLLTEKNSRKKVHEALTEGNYWAKKAPVMVVVATKPDLDARLSDRRDYALLDCGLASENLLLQAFKEGLYAHPMAGFDPLKVKAAFQIPDEYIVITLIAVGYPGELSHLNTKHQELEQSRRVRKPEPEVICYNTWGFDPTLP
jgi:nitroreductase